MEIIRDDGSLSSDRKDVLHKRKSDSVKLVNIQGHQTHDIESYSYPAQNENSSF